MMTFNCPHFIEEFKEYVKSLKVKRILEVGCLSGELKGAVGGDGIDVDPKRPDVMKADIRDFTPGKKYDLVFSSGLLEHFSFEEAVEIVKAMARAGRKYVLNYVPNRGCLAYMKAKTSTTAPWHTEKDFDVDELTLLHERAGLKVVSTGYAGKEWAKRFGPEPSEPYLVYVLALVEYHVPCDIISRSE